MSLRVTTNQAKTSYVVASYVVAVLVLFGVGLTAGLVAASVVWGIMLLATVGVAVRTFRGDDESLTAPRAWWRMSARPTSGVVFAAVFLLQGGYLALSSAQEEHAGAFLVLAVLNLVIGALFVNSSIRVMRIHTGPVSKSNAKPESASHGLA